MSQLHAAVAWEGYDIVAERLGLDVPELKLHLEKGDFTLTELRLLAIACEVHISYNINLGHGPKELSLSSLKKNEKTDD